MPRTVDENQRRDAERDRDHDRDRERDTAETPITVNAVVKWTGIIFTGISLLVSVVWFAALIKGDIITLQQENIAMKREVEIRNTNQDREIDKLKDHADVTDKALAEMARKLDVAVAILERIDKRIDKP